ncbi:MAG: flagellin [Syntrophomonadaceae bacterium]
MLIGRDVAGLNIEQINGKPKKTLLREQTVQPKSEFSNAENPDNVQMEYSFSVDTNNYSAYQNRREYTVSNLESALEHPGQANSRVSDWDSASELLELTKDAIFSQSAAAMRAQANLNPQTVLELLK